MKNFLKRYYIYILGAFLLAETAIYIAFMVIENAMGGDVTALKYSGILLAFAVSVIAAPVNGRDGILLAVALFFTAISDLFIFILYIYEAGVATFILVQIAYFIRLYFRFGRKPYISLAVRAVLIAVTLTALGATGNLTLLTGLVAVYFPMLVCNAAESAILIAKNKWNAIFFAGLVLFIGCDICVGLYNFTNVGISFPREVLDFVGSAIWAFYLPSQTLLVLSGYYGKSYYEK